jgi:hypothetical protein
VAQDPFRSGFGVRRFTEQEVYTLRNPELRFPEVTGAVDLRRDTRRQIPHIGVRRFGVFDTKGTLHFGFAIREIPKRTWQGGSPRHSGRQVACTRGFGTRGFVLHEVCDNTTADFPIGKSPTQEKVDPLTIGVRDLEGPVHGATGLANSRPAKSRIPTDEVPKSDGG